MSLSIDLCSSFSNLHMMVSGFSIHCYQCQGDTKSYCNTCNHNQRLQCKVRQCVQCQGDTEYYCNTCKSDLCLLCKERHVIDLDNISHDVVIYREKFEYIPKQETCVRHPDRIYDMLCHSCKLPVCVKCKEHRKHQIQDIRTLYQTKRQQHREIIRIIRSKTLYQISSLLSGIKNDIKACHTEISHRQSAILRKAQSMKNLIDTVLSDVIFRHKKITHSFQQHKKKMNRCLASMENYERRYEHSTNTAVQFLLFLKKNRLPKMNDTASLTYILTQHALLPRTEEISKNDMIQLLSEIQIIETGKRHLDNESLLKLMPTPVLHRSITLTEVISVHHISYVKSDQVWVSGYKNLILTNTDGDTLHHLTDVKSGWGVHTVTSTCELLYIDKDDNINKLYKDNRTKSLLIKKTDSVSPCSVFCSPLNGNLLVGVYNTATRRGKVIRFTFTGQHIQTIQRNNTGQILYSSPSYITENRNGDVVVSDSNRGAVVVTEREGRHRFSYTGPTSETGLSPRGICTDVLSHILVCDFKTDTVQMLNKDGQFLSMILRQKQGIYGPRGLSYDNKSHLLWIGSFYTNRVCVYRYLNRQGHLTEGWDPTGKKNGRIEKSNKKTCKRRTLTL